MKSWSNFLIWNISRNLTPCLFLIGERMLLLNVYEIPTDPGSIAYDYEWNLANQKQYVLFPVLPSHPALFDTVLNPVLGPGFIRRTRSFLNSCIGSTSLMLFVELISDHSGPAVNSLAANFLNVPTADQCLLMGTLQASRLLSFAMTSVWCFCQIFKQFHHEWFLLQIIRNIWATQAELHTQAWHVGTKPWLCETLGAKWILNNISVCETQVFGGVIEMF